MVITNTNAVASGNYSLNLLEIPEKSSGSGLISITATDPSATVQVELFVYPATDPANPFTLIFGPFALSSIASFPFLFPLIGAEKVTVIAIVTGSGGSYSISIGI